MNVERKLRSSGNTAAMWVNYGCAVVICGSLLGLKIYIAATGEFEARWMVIRFMPLYTFGVIVWLGACAFSVTRWIRHGTSRTPMAERIAALSLPICLILLFIT
ncbi:MAG: hypothetical protein AAGA58_03635 [Verrucomicrobiota bacterium]